MAKGMIDRLPEVGGCYGMEVNVKKLRKLESQGSHSQYRL
jgi:hypothetical protein